jgi:hypothetical protein
MKKTNTTRLLSIAVAFATAVLLGLLMTPYMRNGIWFDDALNSQTWGMVNRFGSSWWDFSMRVTHVWRTEHGRLLFSWPLVYGYFYLIRDAWLVRTIDVALVLAHLACVVYLLRMLRVSWVAIGLFSIFLAALFQIRHDHDPIAAYASFLKLLGIAITGSLILLAKWQQTGRVAYLAGSACVAVLSMLAYELNAVYVPIALGVVLLSRQPRRGISAAIVLVPFALFASAALYVKIGAGKPYDGAAFGSSAAVPIAYFKQLTATLPGSFYVLQGHEAFPPAQLAMAVASSGMAWALGCLALMCSAVLMTQPDDNELPWGALAGASAFLFVPPALIALAAKYQIQLSWGHAHIPVYYQYFGLALIAAVGVRYLCTRQRASAFIIAPIFAAYCASNWVVNNRQAELLDAKFDESRSSLVTALAAGLLDPVRDGDIVEIPNQPIWINGNLIYQTIQKNVSIPGEGAIADWFESNPRSDAIAYRLERDASAGDTWRLSRVN